jgi:hypothetical protein
MIEVATLVATTPFPWQFGLAGIVPLIIGLLIVTQPRKANEAIWRGNQALRPWGMRKPPVGFAIAIGCLLLVLAAFIFYVTWASLRG